jgi:hypothetical protein
VAGAIVVTPWLVALVVLGGLFLPAYNLELVGGRLHTDLTFALGWGAFPAFTGYFVNAEQVRLPGILVAAACALMSVAQRRLSSPARLLRRRALSVEGELRLRDGSVEQLSIPYLLAPLDGALAVLSLTMVVLSCGVLAWRLS